MRADGRLVPRRRLPKARPVQGARHRGRRRRPASRPGRRPATAAALDEALRIGQGACFLARPDRRDPVLVFHHPHRHRQRRVLSGARAQALFVQFAAGLVSGVPRPRADLSVDAGAGGRRGRGDPLARLREFGIDAAADLAEDGRTLPGVPRRAAEPQSPAPSSCTCAARRRVSLPALLRGTPQEVIARLRALELDPRSRLITQDIVPQIEERLKFLAASASATSRSTAPTETLSGGEAQRIRLAAQLGSNLSGVLYVLDEPSIGLHARDNARLIGTLQALRAKGNTLLVVEHDDELMAQADHIIDLGPGRRHPRRRAARRGHAGRDQAHRPLAHRPVSDPGHRPPVARRLPAAAGRPAAGSSCAAPGTATSRASTCGCPWAGWSWSPGPSGAGNPPCPRLAAAGGRPGHQARPADAHRAANSRLPAPRGRGAAPRPGRPAVFGTLRVPERFRSVITVDQSPDRQDPALHAGHLPRHLRPDPAVLRGPARGEDARATPPRASPSTPPAAGARPARAPAGSSSRWPSCRTPTCRARTAAACATGRSWPTSPGRAGTSAGCSSSPSRRPREFFDFHAQLGPVCRLMVDCGLGYLTLGQSSPDALRRRGPAAEACDRAGARTGHLRRAPPGRGAAQPLPAGGADHRPAPERLREADPRAALAGRPGPHRRRHRAQPRPAGRGRLHRRARARRRPAGGELLYQGALAGLARLAGSPTAPYLRQKLRPGRLTSAGRRDAQRRAPSPRPAPP